MKVKQNSIQALFYLIIIILTCLPGKVLSQANPIKFFEDSLNNGLHVIYYIDKSAPVVATVMHYRVGSRDEKDFQRGYAHFFEHLMFEATENIPRSTIDKFVQDAGGNLNAHTSFDETVYYFHLPSNEIKLALWIESQRMRKLKIDTIGVETQRGVVLEEMKQRRENTPYGSMLDKMCSNLFKGGSYSWATIGSAENIKNAKIADFRDFYNNFYQPCNATLVIAGDFDYDEVKQYINDYFGIYPKGNYPLREEFKLMPPEKGVREEIIDVKAQLPRVYIGYQGPKLGDSTYYPLSLLMDILASGESSRLYQRLVDKEQMATSANVSSLTLEKSGLIIFNATASPKKDINKIEKIIFEEIEKVFDKGITDEELQKAKNIRESRLIYGKMNLLEKAMSLAKYYSYFRDADLINTEIDKYLKVTKEDILKAAKLYLKSDKYVVLTYLTKKDEK